MRYLIVLAVVPLLLTARSAYANSQDSINVQTHHLRSVVVSALDGPVHVHASTVSRVYLTLSHSATDPCSLKVRQSHGTLKVRVVSEGGAVCRGTLDAIIPKHVVLLTIHGGRDDVQVDGSLRYVNIVTHIATVRAKGEFTGLTARLESGSVHAEGLLRDVDVQSGAGSADLVYTEAPTKHGKVTVGLACGDLIVTMPSTRLAVEVQLDNGWLQQNENLRAAGDGPVRLTGRIAQGSVVLYTYTPN